jgi:hypothetical protein
MILLEFSVEEVDRFTELGRARFESLFEEVSCSL